MKTKDVFARFAGGTAGAVVAMAVPHIGCLAALTPVFVGVGAGASIATGAVYVAGAVILAGGAYAAWYGLRPSREVCCILWGETPKVRLMKGAAVAACAFAAVAGINTLLDKGPSLEVRAQYLAEEQERGGSVWEAQQRLEAICGTKRWWFSP